MELPSFANQAGLWALLILIPFILLYLIKPRPQDKPIPSLMFLIKNDKVRNQRSLFRTFMRNILFFLQLLILASIAFAIAQPFITVPGIRPADHTILVIDASASMQTREGTSTRFAEAVEKARSGLQGKVTLIVAEHAPFVLLEAGSAREANSFLASLQPKETTSNVGEAILLAGDYASEKARVLVISDFAHTSGTEPIIAAQTLRARGIDVRLEQVGSPRENLGFVNLALDKERTRVYVKNYFTEKKAVRVVETTDGAQTGEQVREIFPGSLEIFEFQTTEGNHEFSIEGSDALPADDILYTAIPDVKRARVLVISNIDADKQQGIATCAQLDARLNQLRAEKKLNEQSSLVKMLAALARINRISCDYVFPPLLPDASRLAEYDIIVLYKFNEREITPVSYRDISQFARDGGALIVTADRPLSGDIIGLLPVEPGQARALNTTVTYTRQALTRNVNFESVDLSRVVSAAPKGDAEVIAQAASETIIARRVEGSGTVTYYGMLEDYSDFATLPDYAIFWGQLIGELTASVDLDEYNFQTGTFITVGDDKKLLEDAGIVEVGGRSIAANVLSAAESDTANIPEVTESEAVKSAREGSANYELGLLPYLVYGALALLLIELLIVKRRGEA